MSDHATHIGDATQSDRLRRGEVISGRYVVDSPIGSGGMGRIYLAHQRPFNRPVALKVMHRESSASRELVERFFQEASTVSHLAHPNTVTVYDFGRTEAGQLYIAMELIDGVSLGDEIKRRRSIPADEAIPYTIQIAQSLGEAHHKGLVHRDLKPDNVMLCRPDGSDPFVKVLDFGIAKVLGRDASWTEVGNIVGTPFYMAPEQAKGQPVDGRTDLYSLGCCLFEMLTGNPPYVNESPVQVLMAHQNAPVPSLPAGFHPALDDFLQRALAKDPDDRPADAATFAAELLATVIEIRGTDSFSGYTPPPGMDRRTRESPIPIPMGTPEDRRAATRSAEIVSSPSEREIQLAETVDGRTESIDEPILSPSVPAQSSPPPTANTWKWLALALSLALVVAVFAPMLMPGDEPQPEPEPAAPAAPVPVMLSADSQPSEAVVYVDGTAVGKTPFSGEIDPDASQIRFEKRGFDPYEATIEPAGKERVQVFAPLERARLTLSVVSPFDATELTVGGQSYGKIRAFQTKSIELAFPQDELVVAFDAPGYEPFIERIDPTIASKQENLAPTADSFVPVAAESSESEE